MRQAQIKRKTLETDISVKINLDGQGQSKIDTGVGFFDHMLSAFLRFAFFDGEIFCKGDTCIDAHHTVEDVGIVLGQAFSEAVGAKAGIARIASAYVPMDEALAFCAADISGRVHLHFDAAFSAPMCGQMDTQLCREFFRAFSQHAGLTLHITVPYGQNDHHIMEAIFKAAGKALGDAVRLDARVKTVHSTKGMLEGKA
jgi:Imidazoleglycerol-phosphate dehydratase